MVTITGIQGRLKEGDLNKASRGFNQAPHDLFLRSEGGP